MQDTPVSQSDSRHLWADFVRNIGILLVILGHVSGMVLQRDDHIPFLDWLAGDLFNVIARACVPLLFMVSGALLLPKQESVGDFYRKRFRRVIFPFLFWSVLYLLWNRAGFEGYTFFNALKTIIVTIVVAPAEYHLWFMYELFGMYMLTPLFRKAVDGQRETVLWYFVAIWFIFGPLKRLFQTYVPYDIIFDLGYLTGYIGYFVLGYLLVRIPLKKWMVWTAAVVYIASALFTAGITAYNFIYNPGKTEFYQNLLGVNIVFLSVSAYILLRAAGEAIFSTPRPRLGKIAVALTSASFGMYLVHVFVLNFLRVKNLGPLDGPTILMIPFTTLLVFAISWIIIFFLQKIPYVRALVA
ncbi:MAG: acyltransferase family protein [Chloroflexi bacterium]|nr:acyltransferase family protein [Chloroflexota bacterium]